MQKFYLPILTEKYSECLLWCLGIHGWFAIEKYRNVNYTGIGQRTNVTLLYD